MGDCQFKSDLGLLYLCGCPLRMYVFNLIKVVRDVEMTELLSKYASDMTTCASASTKNTR
jgi:hypothetical protein